MLKKVQVWIATCSEKNTPQVLLFKLIAARGGGWHPVTGGVEENEALLLAAQRETEEETRIAPGAGVWVDLEYVHSFDGRWGRAEEHVFGLVLSDAPMTIHLDPSEMTEFKWVTFEEAKKEVGFEPQRHALEKFSCYLEKQHGAATQTVSKT
jgi:8-oxo-dGTP pyrophosphatase MutT (NUDIX family)